MRRATQEKYDLFCREYMSNGLNGAQAAIAAGYSEKSARQTGKELLDKPYISDKIRQMQEEVTEKSKEKFTVSVEQRLEWLSSIIALGMESHADMQGNMKPHSLQASTGAISELNKMLGTTDNDTDATALNINFTVSEAVAEVKVTNAAT